MGRGWGGCYRGSKGGRAGSEIRLDRSDILKEMVSQKGFTKMGQQLQKIKILRIDTQKTVVFSFPVPLALYCDGVMEDTYILCYTFFI